jgi:AcrR family transcriptional regulator
MSTSAKTEVSRRPGGRTADVTERVHEAIDQLLRDGGPDACTFSAVAERAGIDRSTLYRRFPDRWDAIIETLLERARMDVMPDLGASFADDLTSVLRKLVETLKSPYGPALLKVAAELRLRAGSNDTAVYFDVRMAQLEPMFEAAIARGELPADVDREGIFTAAAGPVYFRLFIAGRVVDDDFIHSTVSKICWLYCSPSAAAKLSLPARMA